jgi:putative endonuclease
MPTPRARLGAQGEAIAAAHLEAQGLHITDRNYRSRYGEIDLVAEEGDTLVFVEVKARRATAYGTPEE